MPSRSASSTAALVRRRSHSRVLLAAASLLLASAFDSSVALADTKEECRDAYYKTQVLRDAGKLEDAIEEAQTCARDACTKFIRDDCSKWKGELEARVATVIVSAVDATGAPIEEGAVTLDGERWLDRLDGTARVISKGPHTLELTVKGSPPQRQAITIQEGEKNRKFTIALAKAPEASAVHRVGPWVLGGVGIATLAAGAVTGGVVVDAYLTVQDQCSDETETCTPEGVEAQDQGHLLGPVTTTLLVAGAAMVAGGIIWLVVAPKAPAPKGGSVFVAPAVSGDQQGVVVGGSW